MKPNAFAAAVDMERSRRLPEIGALQTVKSGEAGGSLAAALEGLRASMSTPQTVTGDIKGTAVLQQVIRVEPSPLLMGIVQGAKELSISLNGKLGQTMKGSNAATASVSPGLSTFKPTVSGR